MKSWRQANFFFVFILAFLATLLAFPMNGVTAEGSLQPSLPQTLVTGQIVAKVYFSDRDDLNGFAGFLDIWEVNHREGYLVAGLTIDQHESLHRQGYRLEIDQEKTAWINRPFEPSVDKVSGIPGYLCYRTVEEIYSSMDNLQLVFPNLVSLLVIGYSWERMIYGDTAGYDLRLMVLSNKLTSGPKSRFFLVAAVHGREYTTAEAALRFAEDLLSDYGNNPDITWLLDFSEIHILPVANPDGRKHAEEGVLWRKNTDNDDGCSVYPAYGTDLNRNHGFKWGCCGGSSVSPCAATFRGPWPSSEPETQAIQNYASTIFPRQRGPGETDPAPAHSTGILVSLHSYGRLVLWPWAWTSAVTPNGAQLEILGRKLAYLNGSIPQQSHDLYIADGTLDDWAYGELGIAAYTFEMGTAFFEKCGSFEKTVYPQNRDALLYAFKAARMPYENPSGPDSTRLAVTSPHVLAGTLITVTALSHDSLGTGTGGAAEHNPGIAAARYSVDSPSWIEGVAAQEMVPVDGNFDSPMEEVMAVVDTKGWQPGRHMIFVESLNRSGTWGLPAGVFVEVVDHLPYKTRVSVQPRKVLFGWTRKNSVSVAKKVTVLNRGKGDMEVLSVELFGPGRSDFSFTHDCGGQFRPGESCSIAIAANPSRFGQCEATLVISSNDRKKPAKKVHLRANGR